ncbi:hypothetical protein TSO352_16940 [Azospirillum sp. TSO35-2]|nr:hypothetical protein TSO352_16940 [Azospirillum sp. TSO35-2]
MRQACEISALREDLERLAHEAGALRDSVELAVEQVRDRFAALGAEEMTDPVALAPLLQLAVTTLLEIREQARQLDTRTGPLSDDERPSWLGAADAPRVRTTLPDDLGESLPLVPPEPPARVAVRPAPVLAAPVPPAPMSAAMTPPPARPAPPPVAAPLGPVATQPAPERPVEGRPASWLASEPAPAPPPSRAATVRSNGSGTPRPPGGIDWLGPAGR